MLRSTVVGASAFVGRHHHHHHHIYDGARHGIVAAASLPSTLLGGIGGGGVLRRISTTPTASKLFLSSSSSSASVASSSLRLLPWSSSVASARSGGGFAGMIATASTHYHHHHHHSSTVLYARAHLLDGSAGTGGGGGGGAGSSATTTATTSALRAGSTTTAETSTSASSSRIDPAALPPPTPKEIFRTNYRPLPITVETVEMSFDLRPGKTTVTTQMTLSSTKRILAADEDDVLVLDGDDDSVTLVSIAVNGQSLALGVDYETAPNQLLLKNLQPGDQIETVVEIVPEENTQLCGLYRGSDNIYCTQCEAMGFRRITYYPDRPDNMSIFTRVRLEANKKENPVLLSNGNLIEHGDVADDTGRHFAVWSDPFPKPSYLFAAVAGDLGHITDTFTTASGRTVTINIYSEHSNVHKLQHAMDSLKRAMQWDQDRFGLEYDLDLFNIVAVESFNMGAMENKGLNVFNTVCVLADQATATDANYERVEGVIAHEYFHNWTGNRVTCRDWFQLTLKEGLTVFRDQEFSGDMNSAPVKRIEDVRVVRGGQFSEDSGPMSHPIRPESYISMDNFYTATVYRKGAEVIRMYQTILGRDGFRKGMDLYFQRHDGQAVTCDDFLSAMADANDVDLSQFSLWYSTPGTPTVTYEGSYHDGTYTLTLTQTSKSEKPLHIPIVVGLLDKATGSEVVPSTILNMKELTQSFTFDNLQGEVVPSILRDFSAPIKLEPASGQVDLEALAFLAAHDTDGFNRWEAGQQLYTTAIFQSLRGGQDSDYQVTMERIKEAFGRTLGDKETTDYSIQAYNLILPSEGELMEGMAIKDPVGIHHARRTVKKALARAFEKELKQRYDELTAAMESLGEFKVDAVSIGRRSLRNCCLSFLCSIADTDEEQAAAADLATAHYQKANCMTDKMAAFVELASMDGKGTAARDAAIAEFHEDAAGDALVLNKWFTVQAMADLPDVVDRVKALTTHSDFDMVNPNRFRSVVAAFAQNHAAFHDSSGAGYEFISDMILEMDKINPKVSARLGSSLIQWRRYDASRSALMKGQLEKMASADKLSPDLFEIVSRGLK